MMRERVLAIIGVVSIVVLVGAVFAAVVLAQGERSGQADRQRPGSSQAGEVVDRQALGRGQESGLCDGSCDEEACAPKGPQGTSNGGQGLGRTEDRSQREGTCDGDCDEEGPHGAYGAGYGQGQGTRDGECDGDCDEQGLHGPTAGEGQGQRLGGRGQGSGQEYRGSQGSGRNEA